ncbi:MAG TPA: DUF998 domain-containing protein [Gammaproteobacteria bacterium]|nr:DUF998 domain-containing protein [Gammaproteobacteria bacterium]
MINVTSIQNNNSQSIGRGWSNMTIEYAFPWAVRRYALLGVFGLLTFVSSLFVVHLTGIDFDWMRDYVSNLANEPLGWVFIAGTFVHGWGNLALARALYGTLDQGRLRTWAISLFCLAAVGILVAALFPVDPTGQLPTTTGRIHRSAASVTFFSELGALFVFSAAFSYYPHWRNQQRVSLVMSVSAALAMVAFIIALQVDVTPGLAERVALSTLLVWEVWICYQLLRPSGQKIKQ